MKWSPCYKCQEREINCHSGCKKYKEYRNKISKKNKSPEQQFINYRADKFGGGKREIY